MSKHLLKFATEADYKAAKRAHLLVPNVSLVESTYNVHINPAVVSGYEAVTGDIVAYDGNGEIKYIKAESWNDVKGQYTAEAIVVVPASHTQDGTVKAMSLHYMDSLTPENGSLSSASTLRWGPNAVGDTSYTTFTGAARMADPTIENTTYDRNNTVFLPSDSFYYNTASDKGTEGRQNGLKSYIDGIGYYYESGNSNHYDTMCAPSPYKADGSRNEYYYTNTPANNVFSDFGNGLDHTVVLTTKTGVYSGGVNLLKNGITDDDNNEHPGKDIVVVANDGSFTPKENTSVSGHYMVMYSKTTDGVKTWYGIGGYASSATTLELGENAKVFNGWVSGKVLGTDYFYTYPAALACKTYRTAKTSAGKWFLPDMGQLGHIMNGKDRIRYALSEIGSASAGSWSNDWLWSSSEYYSGNAWFLNPSDGTVGRNGCLKYLSGRVRAFAAFNA